MSSRPRHFPTSIAASALCLALLASTGQARAADWRRAVVTEVTTAAAVDPSVDSDCVVARTSAPDARVAVIRYRVGKASYWRALPLRADDAFVAQDEVLVDPGACRIAHRPRAASQP